MVRRFAVAVLVAAFVTGLCAPFAAFGAKLTRKRILRDGFAVTGIVGKLTAPGSDSNDIWLFELAAELSDNRSRIAAGGTVELLPSSALEKMIADASEHSEKTFRLWGEITEYKGRNFIFPLFSLPVSIINEPEPSTQNKQRPWIAINEPNDVLAIPQEIVDKLGKKRAVRTVKLRGTPNTINVRSKDPNNRRQKQDFILSNRTAFLVEQADSSILKICNSKFVLDALGRGLARRVLPALPCKALERAEKKQLSEPDPMRFKISGVVTEYKGRHYLLCQKAVWVHSHENFPR